MRHRAAGLQTLVDVTVPQKPLCALQEPLRVIIGIVGICIGNRDTFGHLLQHRKAHGDVKPIDHVFSPRMQSLGPRSYRVAAIGHEGDGLMVHKALGFQYRANAGASMAIEAVHERETTGSTLLHRGFAGDHLEPTLVAARCISGANVPAIQSHGDPRLGWRDVVRGPFLGTRLRIRFSQQVPFASPGYPMCVTADTIAVNVSVSRAVTP